MLVWALPLRVADGAEPSSRRVSLVRILSAPASFEGKIVETEGWCVRAQEESALYLSREDADYLRTGNSLWLDVTPSLAEKIRFPLSWACQVEGRYSAQVHGHLGLWPGGLKAVARLEEVGRRGALR